MSIRKQAVCLRSCQDQFTAMTEAERAAWIRTKEYGEYIRVRADEDWNAIGSEVSGTVHARRTLENMTPERRAQLEGEWK